MTFRTFLELGRVSNLPTVWSNVLCGALIAQSASTNDLQLPGMTLVAMLLCGTLLYVGGMWLNDAFDAAWDTNNRPERPIPSGRIRRASVFWIGFGMLALGSSFAAVPWSQGGSHLALVWALLTALSIVLYDRWHKNNPWAPMLMGLCRVGLYTMGGYAFTEHPPPLFWLACAALWSYVVGLTHVARFETGARLSQAWVSASLLAPAVVGLYGLGSLENDSTVRLATGGLLLLQLTWIGMALRKVGSPGGIGKAVVSLIAGISLVDTCFLAMTSPATAPAVALACFGSTLLAQRFVPGT
jgi:4-hydroxybenzoate polyprenyltransferase